VVTHLLLSKLERIQEKRIDIETLNSIASGNTVEITLEIFETAREERKTSQVMNENQIFFEYGRTYIQLFFTFIFIFQEQTIYEGYFKDDMYDGEGILY